MNKLNPDQGLSRFYVDLYNQVEKYYESAKSEHEEFGCKSSLPSWDYNKSWVVAGGFKALMKVMKILDRTAQVQGVKIDS